MKIFLKTLGIATVFILCVTMLSLIAQTYVEIEPFNTFANAYNDVVLLVPANKRIREEKIKDMIHKWHSLVKSQGWKDNCEY